MDVVLEVFDTFLFDRLYAAALPASSAAFIQNALPHKLANSTWSSLLEVPRSTSWEYAPATQFLTIQPSKYAYMSAWPRDYVYRQALSLFLITWYAVCHNRHHQGMLTWLQTGSSALSFTLSVQASPTTLSLTRQPSNIPNTSRTK